jgi:ABC-type glycerol-3-phosphate transport system substrate-binding protein
MTLRGQERAFVKQLQLSNKTLLSQLTAMPMTVAVSVSDQELLRMSEVMRDLEKTLGVAITLLPIDRDFLPAILEQRVAAGTKPWDLIIVDNDRLGILAEKGLVQDLSPSLGNAALPRDSLFQSLREKLRMDRRDCFVPFRANVKLMYYNQDMLKEVGYHQPPTTLEEWEQLARDLSSKGLGRVAVQAHPGKAAAVTVFEWVTSQGGNPLTLDGPQARQAFMHLWNVAPYLAPESHNIQFDTANQVLITDRVAVVDNWTYGIKVVMGDFEKQSIHVAPGVRGSVPVLDGDVLAIPTGVPQERKERAIRLIEQLVAKETQRALAEKLFWAPVRDDVYAELSAQPGRQREHFSVIREALRSAVMRPITLHWGVVQDVLSEALQEVLKQGRAQKTPATEAQIDALLRSYRDRLQALSFAEYTRCDLVTQKTVGNEPRVKGPIGTSFAALFRNPKEPPDIKKSPLPSISRPPRWLRSMAVASGIW